MKMTGMTRKMDRLGRIVLPREMFKKMDLHFGDMIEVFYEEDAIIIRKYAPGCALCEDVTTSIWFKGRAVCVNCIDEIRRMD